MDNKKPYETITESLETPITKQYDVVVVGGGPSGTCAAIAAARGGAKTLIIERQGYLGGMLTGGMVGSSGIYTVSPSTLEHHAEIRKRLSTDPDSVHLIKGIPRELMRRLIKRGGGGGYNGEVAPYVCVHVPSLKKLLLDVAEEEKIDIVFYAQGIKPILDGNKVCGVIMQGKGAREAIRAKVIVDATGDGDIAAAAGADFQFGRPSDGEAINMTLMFTIGGIDMEKYVKSEIKEGAAYPLRTHAEHLQDIKVGNSTWLGGSNGFTQKPGFPKELSSQIDNYTWSTNKSRGHIFACNTMAPDELYINVTEKFKKSGIDSWQMSEAIQEIYKQVELLAKMYKTAITGFEKSYIREIAPMLGVRETRRITGDYILNGDDVRSSRKFDDGIAGSSHPIDTSEDGQGRFEHLAGGAWFEVPYRCILVKDFEGILTAGRCISADHDGIGSLRPTAPCMALGQAAGTAAAMAVEKKLTPRQLDGRDVRKKIGWSGDGLADLTKIESGESGKMIQRDT